MSDRDSGGSASAPAWKDDPKVIAARKFICQNASWWGSMAPTKMLDRLCSAVAALAQPAGPTRVSEPTIEDAVVEFELGEWKRRTSEAIFYARAAARSKGYALAVHGTLRRDVDIVAVPWTDEACSADELADFLARDLVKMGQSYEGAYQHMKATREEKPCGRLAFAIPLKGIPAPYLDLSVCPRAVAPVRSAPAPEE